MALMFRAHVQPSKPHPRAEAGAWGRSTARSERAQALTETVLIVALIALAVAGVAFVWRAPLAAYLNRILQALATTR